MTAIILPGSPSFSMKKLFEEIIDLDQAPGVDTKSDMYGAS